MATKLVWPDRSDDGLGEKNMNGVAHKVGSFYYQMSVVASANMSLQEWYLSLIFSHGKRLGILILILNKNLFCIFGLWG